MLAISFLKSLKSLKSQGHQNQHHRVFAKNQLLCLPRTLQRFRSSQPSTPTAPMDCLGKRKSTPRKHDCAGKKDKWNYLLSESPCPNKSLCGWKGHFSGSFSMMSWSIEGMEGCVNLVKLPTHFHASYSESCKSLERFLSLQWNFALKINDCLMTLHSINNSYSCSFLLI